MFFHNPHFHAAVVTCVLSLGYTSETITFSEEDPTKSEPDDHTSTETQTGSDLTAEAHKTVLVDDQEKLLRDDIILTTAALLKNKDFHPLIVQQIRNRFFGYKIAAEKVDERWVFTGPLQGFTAFYRKRSTAPWPNITEFLYEDSRKNIGSPTIILPETNLTETTNLRIYHYPARIGFQEDSYLVEDTLMMVFLNPKSGIRSTYGFRTQGGTYYVYRFPSALLPQKPNEASLVSHLGVATKEDVEIKILFKKLKLSVPRHTFSSHVYRVMDDENYEKTETPLGPPVQFPEALTDPPNLPFLAAIQAFREKRSIESHHFSRIYKLLSSNDELDSEP